MPKFSISSKQLTNQKAVKEFIKRVASLETTQCIMEVVLAQIPLTESEGSPLLTNDVLNRHAVLHGTNVRYATSLNSYRAISWLDYVFSFKRLSTRAKATQC
jgi:hypothetical protein